jgi:hypothetical protein
MIKSRLQDENYSFISYVLLSSFTYCFKSFFVQSGPKRSHLAMPCIEKKVKKNFEITKDFDQPGWFIFPDDPDEVDRDSGSGDEQGHPDDHGVDVEGEEDQEGDDDDECYRNSKTHLNHNLNKNELKYLFLGFVFLIFQVCFISILGIKPFQKLKILIWKFNLLLINSFESEIV